MKIVMVGSLNDLGGIQKHIELLCTQFVAYSDVELHVVSLAEKTESFNSRGIITHLIEEPSNLNDYLKFSVSCLIIKKIIEINPDIVHVHGAYLPYSLIVTELKKIKKFPVILTVHSSIFQEIKTTNGLIRRQYLYFKSIPTFYFKIKALKSADKVIVVSESLKKSILKFVKHESKISIIMNGIDLNNSELNYISPSLSQNSLPDLLHHPSIFFIGRHVKVKGCKLLIQAVPLIQNSIPDIHVYIAGTGPQFNNLKSLVQSLNLSAHVTFLGHVSESKKFELYRGTDLFVLTSYFEAFGITLLEAMAVGKAVVASDIGGVPEVVENGKTGYLFKSGNIDDLATKCINLLNDDEHRVEMGKAGRKRVELLFDSRKIAKSVINLYEQCLELSA